MNREIVNCTYSHSTTYSVLNLLLSYLKFQVRLIDLPQSAIQIPYGVQIDNAIRQCVNSSRIRIFKN